MNLKTPLCYSNFVNTQELTPKNQVLLKKAFNLRYSSVFKTSSHWSTLNILL